MEIAEFIVISVFILSFSFLAIVAAFKIMKF